MRTLTRHHGAAQWALAGLLGLLLLGVQGCGMSSAKPVADAAVISFHSQLDAAQFDAIWNGADERFRNGTTHEAYGKIFAAVHRKLGLVTSTATRGWAVNYVNFETRVVLQQQTQFEHGSGEETFTYIVRDNSAKLVAYNISSTELITL